MCVAKGQNHPRNVLTRGFTCSHITVSVPPVLAHAGGGEKGWRRLSNTGVLCKKLEMYGSYTFINYRAKLVKNFPSV